MDLELDQTGTEGTTRRRIPGRAGTMAVAGAMIPLTETATAAAAVRGGHSVQSFLNFTVTQELFGVTAVTEAIRKTPHSNWKRFLPVLRAAVTTEYWHAHALKNIGAKPLTSKFWIPDAVFHGGINLFTAFAAVEAIEVSLYLVGINAFTARSNAYKVRLCAEALGTEAEHRVLARFAASQFGAPTTPPNNLGFEAFPYKTTAQVRKALTGLGIGYGKPGAHPGHFYEYPGNPLKNGVGVPVESPKPT